MAGKHIVSADDLLGVRENLRCVADSVARIDCLCQEALKPGVDVLPVLQKIKAEAVKADVKIGLPRRAMDDLWAAAGVELKCR